MKESKHVSSGDPFPLYRSLFPVEDITPHFQNNQIQEHVVVGLVVKKREDLTHKGEKRVPNTRVDTELEGFNLLI